MDSLEKQESITIETSEGEILQLFEKLFSVGFDSAFALAIEKFKLSDPEIELRSRYAKMREEEIKKANVIFEKLLKSMLKSY